MNRPGAVPQSLRGIPGGFGGAQQPQQPGRTVSSNRLPNGKLGSNGSGWAFGAGPIASSAGAGLQNSSRQLGGNLSFAQSLGGSQPQTPLDLSRLQAPKPKLVKKSKMAQPPTDEEHARRAKSGAPYAEVLKGEFPSLSGNSQLSNAGQSSLWSTTGSRNLGGPSLQRNQSTPLSSQQGQQDDLFSPPSRLSSAQGSFRFGSQGGSIGQASQPQPGSIDEFPPLNRNANGELTQERGSSLMASLGFGAQPGASAPASPQVGRVGNGLLNALSANTRAAEARSPLGVRTQDGRGSTADEDPRQKKPPYREDSLSSRSPLADGGPQPGPDGRNPLGAIGIDGPSGKPTEDKDDFQDPLGGMSPMDKWGIKGLRTLMNNYPDYNSLVFGIDHNALGLDLNSSELISTQVYSVFDDVLPRPAIPKFRLPECYKVTNVGPIENKITSFNEETLMWIFYSCPNDIKQQLAAIELNNRNWRWHKKLQLWLTKDDLMMPQVLGPSHERGYYIVWDTTNWRKERRDFTLHYADLDTIPIPTGSAL